MSKEQSESDKEKPRRYLESVEHTYVLNQFSGIYEPKPKEIKEECKNRAGTNNRKAPFFVKVPRDGIAILISTLTLFLLGATVLYARRQWTEMHKATVDSGIAANAAKVAANAAERQSLTSERQLELSARPWISAKFVAIDRMLIDQEGVHITIRMELKNTGQSPSVQGFSDVILVSKTNPFRNVEKERSELCEGLEGESRLSTNAKFSQTWLPDEAYTISESITLARKNFDFYKMIAPAKDIPANFIYPIVIACIAYRPSFKDVQYHTGYILDLNRTLNGVNVIPIQNIPATIPTTELTLAEEFGTGIDAH